MTTRFAPFRDVDVMTRSLLGPAPRAAVGPAAPMDAVRSEQGLRLSFDLPGVDPASVELSAERNVLTLVAERAPTTGEHEQVIVSERRQGSIRRQLRLSDGLDLSAITARLDNGVLSVHIPVAESSRSSRIEIEVGSSTVIDSAPVEPTEVDAPGDN